MSPSHIHTERVRFGDLDAMRHLNNVVFLRYFETARIAFLRELMPAHDPSHPEGDAFQVIFAECHINYRSPVRFDEELEVHRRAVVDVALGEDQPEATVREGLVAGRDGVQVRDPGRLVVAQIDDVVEVAHGVEVAEADALDVRVGPAHEERVGRWGIWIRAIALTRNQKSVPAARITARVSTTARRFPARKSPRKA